MNKLCCFALFVLLVGCSTTRTRWSDPGLRVLVDPDGVDPADYVRVEHGILKAGRFHLVTRGRGYRAVKKEQETIHKREPERFDNKEKWAWYAKLYSVKSIIVPFSQCRTQESFWNREKIIKKCLLSLQLYDANTAELIASVEESSEYQMAYDMTYITSDWSEVAAKLADEYPKDWETRYYNEDVQLYRNVSEERAIRLKEGTQQ